MAGRSGSRFKLIIYTVFLAILLLGLGQILNGMSGVPLRLGLAGFLFLVLLALLGFAGYSRGWGENLFLLVFVFYLGNLVLLWYSSSLFYFFLMILASVGCVMGIFKRQEQKKQEHLQEKTEGKAYPLPPEPQTFASRTLNQESGKKTTTFSPGKYVASSRSNTYHEPKCDWAKKIMAKKLWFRDKKEAENKMYKAHTCVR